jgi:hypothetical protein
VANRSAQDNAGPTEHISQKDQNQQKLEFKQYVGGMLVKEDKFGLTKGFERLNKIHVPKEDIFVKLKTANY